MILLALILVPACAALGAYAHRDTAFRTGWLVAAAPAGAKFAIGTEIHLVNRLARRFAPQGKRVMTLDDTGCLCTTMYRISPQHLAWALENLAEDRVVNRIEVDAATRQWARVALERMLELR